MKLRFQVNQAEAFRRGIDCPNSIVTIEVDPGSLDQKTREAVAKRMMGIDVLALTVRFICRDEHGTKVTVALAKTSAYEIATYWTPEGGEISRVIAKGPHLEDLLEAIRLEDEENEKELADRLSSDQSTEDALHYLGDAGSCAEQDRACEKVAD